MPIPHEHGGKMSTKASTIICRFETYIGRSISWFQYFNAPKALTQRLPHFLLWVPVKPPGDYLEQRYVGILTRFDSIIVGQLANVWQSWRILVLLGGATNYKTGCCPKNSVSESEFGARMLCKTYSLVVLSKCRMSNALWLEVQFWFACWFISTDTGVG